MIRKNEKNLESLYANDDLIFEDFTKYHIIGLDEYDIHFPPEAIKKGVIKWISVCDDEEDNEVLFDSEYYYDKENDENGILLIGPYCGELSIKIVPKHGEKEQKRVITIEIVSRFKSICLSDILENLVPRQDDIDILKIQDKTMYYMPKLYEQFVRHKIKEYVSGKEWEVIENPAKQSCLEKDGIVNKNKEKESTTSIPAEVYLEGNLEPDIVLKHKNKDEYLIFDVKYKTGSYNINTRSDRFQILAYAYMWNSKYIGHIFPENRNDEIISIKCNNTELQYVEIECNCNMENFNYLLPPGNSSE